jgi:hypothetical protein
MKHGAGLLRSERLHAASHNLQAGTAQKYGNCPCRSVIAALQQTWHGNCSRRSVKKIAAFRHRVGERASTMDGTSGYHHPALRRCGAAARLAALALLLAPALIAPAGKKAEAAQLCGERREILARLEQAHAETPQALGLTTDGGVIEVLVSPEGGWTILVTYPRRPTCVVAVGEAWEMLPIAAPAA